MLIPMRGNLYAIKEDSLSYQTWLDLNRLLGSGGSGIVSSGTNVIIGNEAFTNIGTPTEDVVIGYRAMAGLSGFADPNVTKSVAIGAYAMGNAGSWESVAVGYKAMENGMSSNANYCVALGSYALQSALNLGEGNIAIGWGAMQSLNNGDYNSYFPGDVGNIAIGLNALKGAVNSSGLGNVAIGLGALSAITNSVHNVAIGHFAGNTITTGTGNVLLGALVTPSSPTASNEFVVGATGIPVNNIYFGKGAVANSPTNYTINGTKSSVSGVAGGSVTIAGGLASNPVTGGGSVVIKTAKAGTGTTLETRATFDGNGLTLDQINYGQQSITLVDTPSGVTPTRHFLSVSNQTGGNAVIDLQMGSLSYGSLITVHYNDGWPNNLTVNGKSGNTATVNVEGTSLWVKTSYGWQMLSVAN